MCFDFDAHPPDLPADLALAPLAGGAGAELLELTSADGTRFSAALAEAPGGSDPGVVILPDVRGLYRFYVELAERFAQAGHHAIAIDYFGRTAGTGERGEEFEFMPHVQQTRVQTVQLDIAAALEALRERTGARGTVTVGFYGRLVPSREGAPAPLEHAAQTRCPVLGLFGGADQAIPPDEVEAFDRGLDDAGVEHEIVSYPGAPHSFFDRMQAEHAEASADAWRRVLGFLEAVAAAA